MRTAVRILLPVSLLFTILATPLRAQAGRDLKVASATLKNGLTVLAMEDHTVPTVAIHIVFKVGSRNERSGVTGLSHLFEHMMFNGSAKYPPKAFDTLIEAGGGYSNAFTSADTTEYMEEFSASTLDTVLRLEADRMRALKLDEANLEQERGIVMEERRVGVDNSVQGSMYELLMNTAFVAHPYRWEIVGFMSDLQAIRLEDAVAYFRTYYAPNNAVMTVVGSFDTDDLMAKMKRYFEKIPRQDPPRPVSSVEPKQQGERRVVLQRPAELPAVMIAYHVGTFKDPENPALDLLGAVLAQGESGRLYRKLVYEDQAATAAWGYNDARLDPGLFVFYAQAQEGHTTAELEKTVYGILEDIARNGVTERELEKARNSMRYSFEQQFTTNGGRAMPLAQHQANWGDWRKIYDYVPRYERVTSEGIRDAAKAVFTDRNRTVVTLIPERATGEGSEAEPAGEGKEG